MGTRSRCTGQKTRLAASVAALLLAAPALAQTNTWTGATDTDFNTATNWSAGTPTGNVVIDYRPANRPTLTGPATLGSATVEGSLTVSATGALTAQGISQTAGILANNGTITSATRTETTGTLQNSASGRIEGGINAGAGSMVTNAGTVTGGIRVAGQGLLSNDRGLVTGGLDNAGTVVTSGAIQGDITNRATGTIVVQGAPVTGDGHFLNTGNATLAVRSGLTGLQSLTNESTAATGILLDPGAALSAGSVTNATGATMFVRGNLSSGTPVANAGTLTVIDSGIVNGGVASTGTILNGGIINGGLTSTGTVTNTAPGTINGAVRSGSAFNNLGTINDTVLIEDGLFDNQGRLRDTVTVVGGRLVSIAPGARIEGGLVNSATAEIAGTLTGTIDNRAGGRITIAGDTAGDGMITNAAGATLALTGGSLTGLNTIDNAGQITASGTRTLGTAGLNNLGSGTVSLQNGAASDSLTIDGPYAGSAGARLLVDADLSKGGTTADRIIVNGPASGISSVAIANTGSGHGLLAGPVDIVTVGTGSTLTLNTGKVAAMPYVNYYLNESAPGSGTYQLTSQLNMAPLTSLATGLSGALASASATLHQPLNPVISRPIGCATNEMFASPFIRFSSGNDRMNSRETSPGTDTLKSRTNATTSAVQGGLDFGICNVAGSRWRLHAGLSAGSVRTSATARTNLAGPGDAAATSTVKLDAPFFALHALAAIDGLTIELTARHERHEASLGTTADGISYLAEGTKLKSSGWTFSGLAAYRLALPSAFYVEPHVGVSKGSVGFRAVTLATGPNDTLEFRSTDTGYARFGVNFGTSLRLGEGLIISPFAHFSLWSSLGSAVRGEARLASIGETVPVSGEAGGNFSQLGGGIMLRSTGGGLSAFLRGDARFGSRMNGQAFSAGLRFRF